MKKILLALVLAGGWGSIACSDHQSVQGIPTGTVADDGTVRILVDFKDSASNEDILDSEQAEGIDLVHSSIIFSATKLTVADVPANEVDKVLADLNDDSDVEVAELDQVYAIPEMEERADDGVYTADLMDDAVGDGGDDDFTGKPNDEYYAKQWHFQMVGLEKAWKSTHGEKVVVAILDTGVSDGKNANYPRVADLKNACFVPGYNFINNNTDPYDRQSHGSHVASTVVEDTNNKIGGAGMAYKACLMPVKVLSDGGSGSTQGIADGIRWATDQGADIISMSLGGGGRSSILEKAVKYAADHNVIVTCAAGNGSRAVIEYPAAYDGCLAISSVGPGGDKNSKSNWGNAETAKLAYYSSYGTQGDGIFVSAPGGDKQIAGDDSAVWQSTVNPGNPKQWLMAPYQGTSMATPVVAGSAALVIGALKAKNNGKFKAAEVKKILASTAVKKDDKAKYGNGVVNVGAAVEKASKKDTNTVYFVVGGGVIGLLIGRSLLKKKKS